MNNIIQKVIGFLIFCQISFTSLGQEAMQNDFTISQNLKIILLGVITPTVDIFMEAIRYFQRQDGIYVLNYCTIERLLEIVYDYEQNGDLTTYLNKINKELSQVQFFEKLYVPIEQRGQCRDVMKNNM